MTTITTPKINNPQNFRTSNTLTTTRKPHYATKANTAFSVIPGMHRPNANNVPSNINQGDFIGPNFKARPLKHWRRQLVPTNPSTDNSSQKRMATVNLMDTPGSTVYKTNAESCKCVKTGGNSFQIEDAYAVNKCDGEETIQNNGAISVPTYVVNDEGYKIITGVYDTVRISCNPENNRIRSGICTLSQAYYETRSGYLQSRCRTAAQRLSTTKKADGVYYPTVNDNIPFQFLYPTNEPNGPQVYQSKNCSNPKTYNNNALNQPANSYCSTVYKPNNAQFACQGAVSGSTRLQKLKADTITSNGFSFYSAYGATMANAGNFQGTNTSSNYYVKNRNYPLDGFIHLNKYRENKQLACCNPPQNIAAPVISGSSFVGNPLSVISNGTWSNNPTSFSYQWYSGTNLILGQTNTSYTTVSGDIGSAITCYVVATNAGGSGAASSNSIVVVVPPPSNSLPPSILGNTLVGNPLSIVNSGTWSNNPTSFSYQWYSGTNLILGQTNTSYTTVSGDIGSTITCQVVATNAGGSSTPEPSNPIVVVPPPPSNSLPPSILGNTLVGNPLSIFNNGTWSNNPTSFSYQWYSGTNLILGQTNTSYTTVSGDIGSTITCQVVATNAGGSSTPEPSNPIVVVPPPPSNSLPPSILGNTLVGNPLSIFNNGTWSNNPTSFSYQWYSGTNLILGQTNTSYTTVSGDIGSTITCQVVATNAGGSSTPEPSNPIVVVPPPPSNSLPPSILGNTLVGNPLSIFNNGTWSNNPTSFSYQWYSGTNLILGQTNTSYTTVSGDIGSTITCQVVATNAGGSSTPEPSNPIVVVPPPPSNSLPPSILGNTLVGNPLSIVNNGTWSNNPTSFSYQWYSGTNLILGQTNTSYTTVSGDIGSTITCQVVATNAGGSSTPEPSNSFVVVAPSIVAVGQGTNNIVYSADGNTWLPSSNGNTIFTNCNDVAWSSSLSIWVAVGDGLNRIATSPDGVTWTASTSANAIFNGAACRGIAWNGTIWVAVGQGTINSIATSPDGVTWIASISGNAVFDGGYGVAWSSLLSRWVAVAIGGGPNIIVYSPDGVTWTPSINGNSTFNTGESVAWSSSLSIWVAVGDGPNTIATSPDGITWTASINGNTIFTNAGIDVAWNGSNLWVAVGNCNGTNTTIATSPDGMTWTASSNSNTTFTFGEGVAWSSSLSIWVAVGVGNSIATSTNGSFWTVSSNGNSLITNGYSVATKI